MGTILDGRPPIKIGGEWRSQGKGPHDDVEVRVAYSLFHAEANAFFLSGVKLTQMSVFAKPDGYLLLLKGKRGKKKLKAWLHADSWRAALTLGSTCLDCDRVPWTLDERPPKG